MPREQGRQAGLAFLRQGARCWQFALADPSLPLLADLSPGGVAQILNRAAVRT
jgi:hypothetical protein